MQNKFDSSTNTHCPHCHSKMRLLRVDNIRYYEAECGYSNIGGVCEHVMSEQETQEMVILNELAPGILRDLRDFGSTAARDWIAAIVKHDWNATGESAKRLSDAVENINDAYGIQDADAIVRGIVHGMQEVI